MEKTPARDYNPYSGVFALEKAKGRVKSLNVFNAVGRKVFG